MRHERKIRKPVPQQKALEAVRGERCLVMAFISSSIAKSLLIAVEVRKSNLRYSLKKSVLEKIETLKYCHFSHLLLSSRYSSSVISLSKF